MKDVKMYRVIDSHVHIYPDEIAAKAVKSIGEFYDFTPDGDGTVKTMLSEADAAGVEKCLVHSVATNPKQVRGINDYIIANVNAHRSRLIGFGTLHPDMPAPADEVERIKRAGLKGIKLHPDFQRFQINDRRMDEAYEAIAASDLPVLLHMGDRRYDYSHPKHIPLLVLRFPKLKIICAHLGGWSKWDEAQEYLKGTNVFVDTSSCSMYMTKEGFKRQIEFFGCDRVLFGSDYPAWNVGRELNAFLDLGFDEEMNKRILSQNICELLKLDEE